MLDVAIFAFNRPDSLRNCVESIRRNIPTARIRVYDDASDDPEQIKYLASLGSAVVYRTTSDQARHGGLYANMNAALADAKHDHILMLQDDMQVVRPMSSDDMQRIREIFSEDPSRAFVGPLFMKAERMRRFRRELRPDYPYRSYVSHPKDAHSKKRCLSYFDVHLAHIARLRAKNWVYDANGEGAIAARARDVFGPMPMMADPFAFFCPEVPFFRHRDKKTLAARIAGHVLGHELKTFHDMTSAEVAAMKARDLSVWPVAEDFLRPTDPRTRRPFVYKDVKARLWLYVLHKAEQRLRG
jgi:glycosyltransferase involved in cell wall biosynthesis